MTKARPLVRRKRAEKRGIALPKVIGIRDLKARASAILAEVREDRVSYEISRRGQVEAMLLPVDPGFTATGAAGDSAWDVFQHLADELGRASEAGNLRSAVIELERTRR
ncbi:MAG: type II toxin-antitoxin system prevent-host-death family antitoxin [Thermoflexales bacterium]